MENPQIQSQAESQINPPVNPNGYGGSTLRPEQIQGLADQGTTPLEKGPVSVPDAFRSKAVGSEAPTTLKDINTPEKVLEKYDDKDPSLQRFGADKPIKELVEIKVSEEEELIDNYQKVFSKDHVAAEELPLINPITAESEGEAELLRTALPAHVPVKVDPQKEKVENMHKDRARQIFENVGPIDLEKITDEIAQETTASIPPFPDYTPPEPTKEV